VMGLLIFVLGAILVASRMLLGPMKKIKIALGEISRGESDIRLREDSVISEIQSMQRGVNHLSQRAQEASSANALALAEKESALEVKREAERESNLMLGVATREIADPVMKIVELLRLNEGSSNPLVSSDVILECAEQVQVSILGMMGKLREQRVSTGLSEIALGDYFLALVSRYSNRFSGKGLELTEKLLGSLDDATYKFDVRMIDIVLEKVLENALMYTDEGSVQLKWAVNADNQTGHILNIEVQDTGCGIDSEDIDQVFDRYFRCGDEESDQPVGSGLGLYIAREIVEALGGSISVDSKATYGSRFKIELPIAREEIELTGAEKGTGKTVLIVGVGLSERNYLESLMVRMGMIPLHAETSIEGLVMMSEQGFDYLLIEESVHDPDVDSFIEEVRKQKIHMGIGVLTDGEVQHQDGILLLGKNPEESDLAELFENTNDSSSDATVDYSLKNRFETHQSNRKE
jgi:signal transduction histidine kinase